MPVTGQEVLQTIAMVKSTLDLLKSARDLLPVNKQRNDLQGAIDKAEISLQELQAENAKSLGYSLCKCTYPPNIMLWRESEKAHVCPNQECGHRVQMGHKSSIVPGGRGGPQSWMGS